MVRPLESNPRPPALRSIAPPTELIPPRLKSNCPYFLPQKFAFMFFFLVSFQTARSSILELAASTTPWCNPARCLNYWWLIEIRAVLCTVVSLFTGECGMFISQNWFADVLRKPKLKVTTSLEYSITVDSFYNNFLVLIITTFFICSCRYHSINFLIWIKFKKCLDNKHAKCVILEQIFLLHMSQNVIINLIINSIHLSVSDWINLWLDKICKIYVIRPDPFTTLVDERVVQRFHDWCTDQPLIHWHSQYILRLGKSLTCDKPIQFILDSPCSLYKLRLGKTNCVVVPLYLLEKKINSEEWRCCVFSLKIGHFPPAVFFNLKIIENGSCACWPLDCKYCFRKK